MGSWAEEHLVTVGGFSLRAVGSRSLQVVPTRVGGYLVEVDGPTGAIADLSCWLMVVASDCGKCHSSGGGLSQGCSPRPPCSSSPRFTDHQALTLQEDRLCPLLGPPTP